MYKLQYSCSIAILTSCISTHKKFTWTDFGGIYTPYTPVATALHSIIISDVDPEAGMRGEVAIGNPPGKKCRVEKYDDDAAAAAADDDDERMCFNVA